MLPVCTCRRSHRLKLQPLDYAAILLYPTGHSLFFPHTLCPVCATCHMDVIADKRKLMHVESMAAATHAHINKTPTYSYVRSTVMLSGSNVLLFAEGGTKQVFMLETGLGSDV